MENYSSIADERARGRGHKVTDGSEWPAYCHLMDQPARAADGEKAIALVQRNQGRRRAQYGIIESLLGPQYRASPAQSSVQSWRQRQ